MICLPSEKHQTPVNTSLILSKSQPATQAGASKYFSLTVNALLGAAFLVDLFMARIGGALDAATIVLAAAASIGALNRRLPMQNVLSVALITGIIGGAAHAVSANSGLAMPFGPIVFSPAAGAKIFNVVPWTVPLLWIIALFNSRGVARLILRPWRKVEDYGFRVTGLTMALAVAFDLALEPFARHVKHWWLWQPTKLAINWQGAAPLNFVGWAFVSFLILVLSGPLLIRKQPGTAGTTGFHPLAIWLGALLMFAIGSAGAGFWPAAAVDTAIAAITAYYSIRGARW